MISRKSRYGIIDFSEGDNNGNEMVSYCKHSEKYGFKVQLRNRIYPDGPIASDHDLFKQCHQCGEIIPIFELKKESKLQDVVEPSDNPFDNGVSFLGIDSRTSVGGRNAAKKRKQRDTLDYINDDDLKRELRKGHTLLSYSEHQPQ